MVTIIKKDMKVPEIEEILAKRGTELDKKRSDKLKKHFGSQENRGKGIAKMILAELERWAEENGNKTSFLETGIKQYEAIIFYTNFGYERIENYGQYVGNVNSICMSKKITPKYMQ